MENIVVVHGERIKISSEGQVVVEVCSQKTDNAGLCHWSESVFTGGVNASLDYRNSTITVKIFDHGLVCVQVGSQDGVDLAEMRHRNVTRDSYIVEEKNPPFAYLFDMKECGDFVYVIRPTVHLEDGIVNDGSSVGENPDGDRSGGNTRASNDKPLQNKPTGGKQNSKRSAVDATGNTGTKKSRIEEVVDVSEGDFHTPQTKTVVYVEDSQADVGDVASRTSSSPETQVVPETQINHADLSSGVVEIPGTSKTEDRERNNNTGPTSSDEFLIPSVKMIGCTTAGRKAQSSCGKNSDSDFEDITPGFGSNIEMPAQGSLRRSTRQQSIITSAKLKKLAVEMSRTHSDKTDTSSAHDEDESATDSEYLEEREDDDDHGDEVEDDFVEDAEADDDENDGDDNDDDGSGGSRELPSRPPGSRDDDDDDDDDDGSGGSRELPSLPPGNNDGDAAGDIAAENQRRGSAGNGGQPSRGVFGRKTDGTIGFSRKKSSPSAQSTSAGAGNPASKNRKKFKCPEPGCPYTSLTRSALSNHHIRIHHVKISAKALLSARKRKGFGWDSQKMDSGSQELRQIELDLEKTHQVPLIVEVRSKNIYVVILLDVTDPPNEDHLWTYLQKHRGPIYWYAGISGTRIITSIPDHHYTGTTSLNNCLKKGMTAYLVYTERFEDGGQAEAFEAFLTLIGFAHLQYQDVPLEKSAGSQDDDGGEEMAPFFEIINEKFQRNNARKVLENGKYMTRTDLIKAQYFAHRATRFPICTDGCTRQHNPWKNLPFTVPIHPNVCYKQLAIEKGNDATKNAAPKKKRGNNVTKLSKSVVRPASDINVDDFVILVGRFKVKRDMVKLYDCSCGAAKKVQRSCIVQHVINHHGSLKQYTDFKLKTCERKLELWNKQRSSTQTWPCTEPECRAPAFKTKKDLAQHRFTHHGSNANSSTASALRTKFMYSKKKIGSETNSQSFSTGSQERQDIEAYIDAEDFRVIDVEIGRDPNRPYTLYIAIAVYLPKPLQEPELMEYFRQKMREDENFVVEWYCGISAGRFVDLPPHHYSKNTTLSESMKSGATVYVIHTETIDSGDAASNRIKISAKEAYLQVVGFAHESHKEVPGYSHFKGQEPSILNQKMEATNAVEAIDYVGEKGEMILTERDLQLAQVQAGKRNSQIFCIDCTKVHNRWGNFPFTLPLHPKEFRLQPPIFTTSGTTDKD